jgi:hypothetical protein
MRQTQVPPRQKIRPFPKGTRPFNYARLKEDETPHLHTLSFKEHTSDNAQAGSEHARGKEEESPFGENEHYAPSSDGSDLADQMDRLLNGGTALSPELRANNNNAYEDGSELVDYEDEEEPGMIFRNEPEDDRTRNINAFGDNLEDADKSFDDNRFEQEDKVGDEQPAI